MSIWKLTTTRQNFQVLNWWCLIGSWFSLERKSISGWIITTSLRPHWKWWFISGKSSPNGLNSGRWITIIHPEINAWLLTSRGNDDFIRSLCGHTPRAIATCPTHTFRKFYHSSLWPVWLLRVVKQPGWLEGLLHHFLPLGWCKRRIVWRVENLWKSLGWEG